MEVISSKISLPTSDTTQMETDDKSEKEELRLNLDESDSDDELIVSRGVKIYQKTKAKAFDSDDEDNSHLLTNLPVPSNEMDTSEDSQLFKEVNKSSRRFLLKDSDDEDEKPLSKLELIDDKNSSNGETVVTKKKRIFTHSSDSEDEVPLEETVANSSCKNSTDESESEITKENEKPTWLNFDSSNITETTKAGKRSSGGHGQSNLETPSDGINWKSKLSSDLFSDDESSNNEDGYSLEDIKLAAKQKLKLAAHEQPNSEKKRNRKSDPSKKVAKEETQKIHSESQRMVRESMVALPYHKPKQRTLAEFMSRKRVTTTDRSLKPGLRDLDAVAQVLEDRAKELETFFKSDSEGSDVEGRTDTPTADTSPLAEEATTENNAPKEEQVEPAALSNISHQPQPFIDSAEPSEITEPDTVVVEPPPQSSDTANTVERTEGLNSLAVLEESVSVDLHKERLADLKRMSIANISKPSLHGRPGQVIDLNDGTDECGSVTKAGVECLIERFVEQVSSHKKSPRKKEVQLNIVKKVVGPEGQIELKNDVISVPVGEPSDGSDANASSSRRRHMVREALRQSIAARRAAGRAQQQRHQRIDNEEFDSDAEEQSEEESDDVETDPDEQEDHTTSRKPKTTSKKATKKRKSLFLDDEAGDTGDEGDGEVDDDNYESEEEEEINEDKESVESFSENVAETVARDRDDQGGEDDSSKNGDAKGLSLSPNLDLRSQATDAAPVCWQEPLESQERQITDELIGLCSGRFGPTVVSRNLFNGSQSKSEAFDDEEEDRGFQRILPLDDDEDDKPFASRISPVDALSGNAVDDTAVFLSDDDDENKGSKRKARLFVSDDEEEAGTMDGKYGHASEEDALNDDEEEMHEEEKEFRGIKDFFEGEAELSGSEIGSGDEREDEHDDWEEEDGDKEIFDETQVRDQLGRAHLKTLLDEDQRDVRLIQELFLEDGDLHSEGGGRQRQFRWKDIATFGAMEDSGPPQGAEEDDADEDPSQEQQDSVWRRLRQEREKWLQEQQASKQETVVDGESDGLLMKRNVRVVKVNNASVVAPAAKAEVPPVVPFRKSLPNAMVKRGSFLRRSDKDLSTIASLTKSVLPVAAPKAGTNFVFATITPERPAAENRKQKPSDSLESAKPPAKKAKAAPPPAKSLFSYLQ